MAPVITLVVPSRLQHRARRSLTRPTAERPRKTPASRLHPHCARRPFAAPARTRAGRRPPPASTPVGDISSHLTSHAQPRDRVGRTRHASCSQSLLDSQFGLRWAVPSSQEPRQSTGLRQMRPSTGCLEPRPAASHRPHGQPRAMAEPARAGRAWAACSFATRRRAIAAG